MLTFHLPLKWKGQLDMPSGVFRGQAAVVGGKVYIGGGGAEGQKYKVLEYTIRRNEWREIETPVKYYGLVALNGKVMITGGLDKKNVITNQVWVLDNLSDAWVQPFPPLPEAKCQISAVSYKKWILVVGGKRNTGACADVHILDSTSKVWYTALSPLPWEVARPLLTVIQDTVYVASTIRTVSASIPALLSSTVVLHHTASDSNIHKPVSIAWQPLPDTPTRHPVLVTYHGLLLSLGTWVSPPSSTIAVYCPQTEQWLTVAQLPTLRRACTCVVLPDAEESVMMVIGGWDHDEKYIRTIDLCTLSNRSFYNNN